MWCCCCREGEELEVRAGYPPEDTLDEGDLAAAKWAFEHGQRSRARRRHFAGRAAAVPAHAHGARHGGDHRPGQRAGQARLLTPDQRRLLDSLSDQTALAIERLHLAEEMDRARVAAETEKLRSALLTSISHDLRTPLASILGSATSPESSIAASWARRTRTNCCGTIQEEAERLNHFIANLLDMTRLESGALAPNLEPVDLGDVVG